MLLHLTDREEHCWTSIYWTGCMLFQTDREVGGLNCEEF
jgi:hypothetical protein